MITATIKNVLSYTGRFVLLKTGVTFRRSRSPECALYQRLENELERMHTGIKIMSEKPYKRSAAVKNIYINIGWYLEVMSKAGRTPSQITVSKADYKKLVADDKARARAAGIKGKIDADLSYNGFTIRSI